MKITNLIPFYNTDGSVKEIRVTLSSSGTTGLDFNADVVLNSSEVDLQKIVELCKNKIKESVSE